MKLSTVAVSFVAGLAGGAVVWFGQNWSFSVSPGEVSYEDLVAVMLTGVSILLAVVGVGLAILAFLGWTTFRGMTREAAGSAAIEHIKSDGGAQEIRRVVEGSALQFLQEGLRDGSLIALAEQRNREADELAEVDADWGNVEVQEAEDGK